MSNHQKFNCFIIGEGTLPIQCAQILLQREHTLLGFISPDTAAKEWAAARNIPFLVPTPANLLAFLGQQPFDYLFSIVNSTVLPAEVLSLPRHYAINYHDSPLPRYAGSHATSWAIMNQETELAISWHVMTGQIDAGDILKQYPVSVTPQETALTLNAKCYHAASLAFTELIDELAEGRTQAVPQNLANRTYFPLYQQPAGGGILNWQHNAATLDALVRALDFGPYPNPLGLPKIALNEEFVIVSQLEVLPESAPATPGTILNITSNSLIVATSTQPVALKKFSTLDGLPLAVTNLTSQFGLASGYQLPLPDSEMAQRLTSAYSLTARHENFWVKRLLDLQLISLPYKNTVSPTNAAPLQSLPLTIPTDVAAFLTGRSQDIPLAQVLLVAFVVYLARINDNYTFEVGLKTKLPPELAGLEQFFATCIPLSVTLDSDWCFEQVYQAVNSQLELVKHCITYTRDVSTRHPELTQFKETLAGHPWPVVIEIVENLADYQIKTEAELTFVIAPNGDCAWFYDSAYYTAENISGISEQFMVLLRGGMANPQAPIWAWPLLNTSQRHQLLTE